MDLKNICKTAWDLNFQKTKVDYELWEPIKNIIKQKVTFCEIFKDKSVCAKFALDFGYRLEPAITFNIKAVEIDDLCKKRISKKDFNTVLEKYKGII